jgi:lysophospholipase L1-like esterase
MFRVASESHFARWECRQDNGYLYPDSDLYGYGEQMKRTRWLLVAGVVLLLASSTLFALFFFRGASINSPTSTIRVACVGDSITEGTGYVDDLRMMLGVNYTVGNFGVGGASVSELKPYMSQPEFQEAEDFQPDIVVIMLGTNDAPAIPTGHIVNFTGNYEQLIRAFQVLPSKPEIWLVKPPPIFNNGTRLSTSFFVQEVIPRIEQVANETGLPLIDVYTPLLSHPEYFLDGVHAYGEGARIVATQVFDAITDNAKS